MSEKIACAWITGEKTFSVIGDTGTVVNVDLNFQIPEPIPAGDQAITMFDQGQMQVFVKDADATAEGRVEKVLGIYKNGNISFYMKTLADKFSMQGGRLMLVPNPVQDLIKWGGAHWLIRGAIEISAPRRPETPKVVGTAEWITGPDGRYAIAFKAPMNGVLTEVFGKADSSNDYPWNWYYGLEIVGSIPLIP